ncbi:MAG: SAM-dependent methyltransferase [Candidatus Acidiferrales bacterium]
MRSGFYEALVREGRLIPHDEAEVPPSAPGAYKILRPAVIPFVSYPYEWCFSQLKDAALLTLEIQKIALAHGMSLKDGSAYNIQFVDGRPIFVDTLSFERLREGEPWVAYRQFCQHFLAPLALMSRRDVRLSQMLRVHMDGVPLDLAHELLPWGTYFRPSLLFHVHLHAGAQRRYRSSAGNHNGNRKRMSRTALLGLIDSLEGALRSLHWKARGTEWASYYEDTNYSPQALEHKKILVSEFLTAVRPAGVWDLGGNVGVFSRLASNQQIPTICMDADPAAVEMNYQDCVARGEKHMLPLVQDFTNPSAGIGWANEERLPLEARGPADAALALALVHHLAIGNNVPLPRIADMLRRLCCHLLIEFVPKHDSQVQRLLRSRQDVFTDYHQSAFEKEFAECFTITGAEKIRGSERTVYRMQRRLAA